MSAPRATMRLQFHAAFTFADAQASLPYFAALGVSHLYASPITTARPGSTHGYDTIDPTRINPELGGEEGLRRLVGELRRHEMGLIVDIVPNHMAVGSGNFWWMDVLARGRDSRYARYFDIDWEPDNPHLRGKVLLPILGRPYGEALAAGEIALRGDNAGNAFIQYFDHKFPLAAGTRALCEHPSPAAFEPASAGGRERLHQLLEEQHYRLAWWRSANDEINWRRFFDINELVAVRVDDDEVFEAVHATLFRLYAEGLIDGVRVDHIDGLAEPQEYCTKLRARLRSLEHERPHGCPGGQAYFIVEKILTHDERLPQSWKTDGTTGYDFMDEVSALQHDATAEQPLTDLWERVSGRCDFGREEELARREILQRSFSSLLDGVARAFYQIAQGDLAMRDMPRPAIHRVLTEILVHFPVYRIYAGVARVSSPDLAFLSQAVARAKTTCLPSDRWLVEIIGKWLGGARVRSGIDAQQTIALARFQQLSASLCAKAVEDTALYRYGRLLSRNDVGFDPRRLSCTSSEFHRRMQQRTADFPHAMLATATHDHKRGEDVRARLAVLSEVPGEWAQAAERWIALCLAHCAAANATPAPSAGDIAILLQTIVGAWPPGLRPTNRDRLTAYAERVAAWQQKALREAKLFSDWSATNETYEHAARELVAWLLAGTSELLTEIAAFARRIAPAGAANGLAQTMLKLTAPGVPDIYQGTEYWDFSLVDPDNRSPVDFATRKRLLEAAPPTALAGLTRDWTDGRIKQAMIARVLAVRKKMSGLFADGGYVPLEAVGPFAEHVFAFARILGNSVAVVAIVRCCVKVLRDDGSLTIPPARWNDTRILLPRELEGCGFSSALAGEEIAPTNRAFAVAQILSDLPVALLSGHLR